jgi:transglutaminase/protease-like cytokinesis protein 3
MGDRYMLKRIMMIAVILLFIGMPVKAGAQATMTKDDVYRTIRDDFVAHKSEFTISMSTKLLKEIGTNADLLDAAATIDSKNTSKDGDYLEVSVLSWQENWQYDNMGKASITITAKYRTTAKQEKLLDDEIRKVLNSLNLKNKTDYQKVKAIHDYIIKNVSYDQSLKKYSAYNALINKSAVCEGYAAAAYRMFLDSGIDSRIISGTTAGGAHIWNIVKVNGKWYNIDLTWDDPITSNGKPSLRYDYFLKSDKAFRDHVRDSEYTTKEFLSAYPIAARDY